jgi:hypothetical protein
MAMSQGTALITGASTGIGAIYADRLAHRGHDLVLVARDVARLDALATRLRAEAGVRVDVLPADLSDRAQLAKVEARIATDETLTLLVNNAGISLEGTLIDTPAATIEQLIAINVTAPTLLAGAAVRAFASRGKGGIINLSSVPATYPYPGGNVYGATKAFVRQFTLNLRADLIGTGVRVTSIEPGMVDSDLKYSTTSGARERVIDFYKTAIPAASVARAIAFAIEQPADVDINEIVLRPTAQEF